MTLLRWGDPGRKDQLRGGLRGRSLREGCLGKSGQPLISEDEGVVFRHNELIRSTLARKTSKELFRCPYRKPTQVDEERILRRSS